MMSMPDPMRPFGGRTLLALATSVTVFACNDRAPTTSPRQALPPDASFDIVDGAHLGGNPHFYFLPPLVAQPRPAGDFDPSLLTRLAVEVCELRVSACAASVARFTAGGPGAESLRIADDGGPLYMVEWQTGRSGLVAGATYRLTVLVGTSALGFADLVALSSGAGARGVDQSRYVPLVIGRTLPVKFRVEQGAVAHVGAAGGTFTALGGLVTITVPPGAVSGTADITAMPADLPPGTDPGFVSGTTVEMSPHGVTFAAPIQLSIRYDPAQLPAGVDPLALTLAKLIDGVWVPIPGSTVDPVTHTVTAATPAFSPFGVYMCGGQTSPLACPTGSLSVQGPVVVGQGLQRAVHVAISPPAPAGGVQVTATTFSPWSTLVAPDAQTTGAMSAVVTIPGGATQATFFVQGEALAPLLGAGAITVSARSLVLPQRYSATTVSVPVVSPMWQITDLPSTVLLPNDVGFQVCTGIVPPNTSTFERQALKAGSSSSGIALTSAAPAVAEFSMLGIPAGSVSSSETLVLLAGQYCTSSSATLGGLALHPLAAGTTTVNAHMDPPFIPGPNGSEQVTVVALVLDAGRGITVGSGLEKQTTGLLNAPAPPGGLTVWLTTSDANLAVVSKDLMTAGARSIPITVAAGASSFQYVVQALPGRTGNVTITASSGPSVTSGQMTAAVVMPAVQLVGVPATMLTTSPPQDFQVEVGIPEITQGGMPLLGEAQPVSAGGTALTVTLQLRITQPPAVKYVTGSTVPEVTIQPGASRSPATLAAGGVQVAPLAPGWATLVAVIPGFNETAADTPTVHVTSPVDHVVVTPASATVAVGGGARLTATAYDAANTPLDVALTWSVSGTSATLGATVPNPAGSPPYSQSIVVLGSQLGQSTVTASAMGSSGSATVSVLPSFDLGPAPVLAGGLQRHYFVTFGTGNLNGVTVRVASLNPQKVLIAAYDTSTDVCACGYVDIRTAPGQTSFSYVAMALQSSDTTNIEVSAPGFADAYTVVTLVQPAVELWAPPNTGAAGGDQQFLVRIGVADPTNSRVADLQAIRIGGTAVTAQVTNSDAGIAQLITTPPTSCNAAAQCVMVVIDVDRSSAPVTLHPLAVGSTTIAASIPGFITTAAATRTVTASP